jgi:putative copper export protein
MEQIFDLPDFEKTVQEDYMHLNIVKAIIFLTPLIVAMGVYYVINRRRKTSYIYINTEEDENPNT